MVPTNTETKTEIPGGVLKLGVIMPLSGDAAIYGDNELKGVQIAVSEINAAGGVDGAQIELVVEDGKCNPEGAQPRGINWSTSTWSSSSLAARVPARRSVSPH